MSNIKIAQQLKEALDALRPLKKEDELRVMQKFRLDWNYHSNHLEGNSLSYGETKALILFGITAQGKPLKDHLEIEGHNEAINWIIDITSQQRPLTENFIRELHQLILKKSYEVDAITPDGQPTKKKVQIGVYKTTPNHVKTKTGEIFRFATPEETPAKMKDLVDWYRDQVKSKDKNPILLASEFHYKFIRIHPFDDGNGRTARILMNFILMQFGFPPVVIRTEDKKNYFAVLRQADAGIITPFFEYIAQNLCRSLEVMIKGAKGEIVEEPDDLEKEIALLDQQLKGFDKKITTIKSKEAILQVYDHSILPLIKYLLKKGKLFEKYYIKSTPRIIINNIGYLLAQKKNNRKIIESTKEAINSIELQYHFETFNIAQLEQFDHIFYLRFKFERAKYFVGNQIEKDFTENFYEDQLTQEEINQIVNSEMRKHKDFIEAKIAAANNNK